jgi:hypothetical protein
MKDEVIDRLVEWIPTAENAVGEVAPADALQRVIVAGRLLLWAETTHGNDFGHDHHCPVPTDYKVGAWASPTGDPEVCTCGWSAFRMAYDSMQAEALIEKGEYVPDPEGPA